MADAVDIGLTKRNAIAGRGSRKDLLDLHVIDRQAAALRGPPGVVPATRPGTPGALPGRG